MVNDEKVSIVYAGNGTTRVFDYPYTFTEPDEITGYLSDGTTVTKITSNFEFNTTTKQYTYPTTGASIATGYNLLLTRHTEKSNKVDLPHESPFDDIERQFDKIVRILQEIDSNEGTGVGVTVIGNGFNGMIPKGRPYAYIRFNKDASAFEVVDDPFIEAESTLETIRVLRSDMQTLQSDMETARDAVEAAKESVNNTVGSFKSEANTLLANHKNELTSLSASLANNVTECGNEALAQLQAYYSEKAQRIEAAAGYATQAKESADAAAASAAQAAADKATVQAVRDDVLINKQSVEATVQNFETLADEVKANKNTMENLAAIVANDKYDVGQMKDAANTSVINAANSATNAANSAAEAKTYKDQAKAIVGGNFLTELDASQTYATITDMNTKANQTSLDELKATVNANTQAISTKQPSGSYLTTTDASNTYLTKEDASSTYLDKTTASQTYATSENLNSALTRLSTAESNITSLTNNKADITTVSTLQTQVDSNTNAITTKQPKGNYATVEYVDERVANVVNSAPETLDTLNELANALGNDPNFATTVSTQIGKKANKTDVESQIEDVNTKLSQAVTTLQNGVVSSVEGEKGEVNLWDILHRYGENYVPTDTSNRGWNSLGICIIYYTEYLIKNQPNQYGQLINIPASKIKNDESMQIWITHCDGRMYTRGGNTDININDRPFIPVGREDRVYLTNGAQIWVE